MDVKVSPRLKTKMKNITINKLREIGVILFDYREPERERWKPVEIQTVVPWRWFMKKRVTTSVGPLPSDQNCGLISSSSSDSPRCLQLLRVRITHTRVYRVSIKILPPRAREWTPRRNIRLSSSPFSRTTYISFFFFYIKLQRNSGEDKFKALPRWKMESTIWKKC